MSEEHTALVVDDSAAARFMIKRMMMELGWNVVEAQDGRVALERLNATSTVEVRRIPLALIDWNMPVMDGLELVQAIRADPTHRSLKILMATTETEMTQVVRAIEAGADEYVMKPFSKEMVADKLRLLGFKVPLS